MFDFESPFKEAADQAAEMDSDTEKFTELATAPAWEDADWEDITDAHATAEEASGRADARQSPEKMKERIYRKIDARHRERIGIAAARYAALAIGLTDIGWIVRDITWLAATLGIVALICGLLSSYGIGKYHESGK